MKSFSLVFWVLAVLLSDVMCAVAAYNYRDMLWGIQYGGYSAPAWTALLVAVPYGIGIAVCVILALSFRRKAG